MTGISNLAVTNTNTPLAETLEKIVERLAAIRDIKAAETRIVANHFPNAHDLDKYEATGTPPARNSRATRALRPPPRWGINE